MTQPMQARFAGPEGLTVIGEAARNTQPEIVELAFDVHSAGPSATLALQENSAKAAQVGQALKSAGMTQSDMQMGATTVWPIFQPALGALPMAAGPPQLLPGISFGPPGPLAPFSAMAPETPQLAGYHAVSFMKLTVREPARVGDAVDAVTRAGGTINSGFLFRLRDEGSLRRTLLTEAGRDARDKADAIAGALGKSVGDPVLVNEDFSAYQLHNGHSYHRGPFLMAPSGTLLRVPFTPGELTFHARVSVTYRMQ